MHLPWGAQKGPVVRISEIPVELVCWYGSSQTPLNIIEVVCPPIFLVEQIVCFDEQRGVEAVPQAVERLLAFKSTQVRSGSFRSSTPPSGSEYSNRLPVCMR